MENEPSPLYIFSQEKRRNNNTINSNNKSKSNKDINIDTSLSREENKFTKDGDIINILKQRFNDNIYFTKINRNLIYLNPFDNEDDIFGEDIKFVFKSINENENVNSTSNEFHLFKTINEIISELKKNKCNKCSLLLQGDS